MNLKRLIAATTLTAGLAAAGSLGVGTVAADPGRPCEGPHNACQQPQHNNAPQNSGPAPADWQHRGIDAGRQDHRPFNWNGRQVTPLPAGNGHGWGFWFLGTWIPL
jgi:hypothetical protein